MGRTKLLRIGRRKSERNGWSNCRDLVFGSDQLPAAFVHHPMMPAAEKDQVVEVGWAALDPVREVMSIAPRWRTFATRPLAMLVAHLQRLAHRSSDHSLGATDVDHQ